MIIFYDSIDLQNVTGKIASQLRFRLERLNNSLDEFYSVNSEIAFLDDTSDETEVLVFENTFYISLKIEQVVPSYNNSTITSINSQMPVSSGETAEGKIADY